MRCNSPQAMSRSQRIREQSGATYADMSRAMTYAPTYSTTRSRLRLTLVDQLVAWLLYRSGEPVSQIAYTLRRPLPQVRDILWGRSHRLDPDSP